MKSEMYYRGVSHGRDESILCAFGGSKMCVPVFESADEEFDYWSGYDDGYASID